MADLVMLLWLSFILVVLLAVMLVGLLTITAGLVFFGPHVAGVKTGSNYIKIRKKNLVGEIK